MLITRTRSSSILRCFNLCLFPYLVFVSQLSPNFCIHMNVLMHFNSSNMSHSKLRLLLPCFV
jgi:hypothetical protein